MIYCTECKHLNDEARSVCEKCGYDLSDCPIVPKVNVRLITKQRSDDFKRAGLIAGLVWLIVLAAVAAIAAVRGIFFGTINAASIVLAGVSIISLIPWFVDRMIHERMYDWFKEWKLWGKRWRDEWDGFEGSVNVTNRFERMYKIDIAIAGGIAFVAMFLAFIFSFV